MPFMAVLGMLPRTIFLGLTSLAAVSLLLERGPLPFYSEKNVRTVCSMKIRQLSFYGGGVRGVRMSNE